MQDCLELCNNLLRGSPSNQTFFRESSFLNTLPEVVSAKIPAPSAGEPPLAAQKAANLLCALELVTLLVSDGQVRGVVKPSRGGETDDAVAAELAARDAAARATCRVANQAALVRVGMMDALLALCLGQRAPNSVPVRVFAFRCLGDLVADSRKTRMRCLARRVAAPGRRDFSASPSTPSSPRSSRRFASRFAARIAPSDMPPKVSSRGVSAGTTSCS